MEELYENLYGASVTVISNEFLNQYLADTKSEYIKVFLFYLWKGMKENYTIEETSSEIDLDANVVEMALKFWIKKKLMKKECLKKDKEEKRSNQKETDNLLNFQDKKNELIKKNRKDYNEVESDLLFVGEKLLGQVLTERQQNLIAKCYNEYGFNEELIQFLLEHCSNGSKRDARYMANIASSWFERGIQTVEEAKKYVDICENKKNGKNDASKSKTIRALDRQTGYYSSLFKDALAK